MLTRLWGIGLHYQAKAAAPPWNVQTVDDLVAAVGQRVQAGEHPRVYFTAFASNLRRDTCLHEQTNGRTHHIQDFNHCVYTTLVHLFRALRQLDIANVDLRNRAFANARLRDYWGGAAAPYPYQLALERARTSASKRCSCFLRERCEQEAECEWHGTNTNRRGICKPAPTSRRPVDWGFEGSDPNWKGQHERSGGRDVNINNGLVPPGAQYLAQWRLPPNRSN